MPRSQWAGRSFRSFVAARAAATFTYDAKGSTSVTVGAHALGGTVLVTVFRSDTSSTASLTGTLTGTFTRIATQTNATTGFRCELWAATDYGTSGGTVTPNTAGTVVQMTATFVANATAVAQVKGAEGDDASPLVTLDASPSKEVYYVAQLNAAAGGNGTPNTGYTALTANGDFYGLRHGYRVVAAGATAGLTAGASGTWAAVAVEFA